MGVIRSLGRSLLCGLSVAVALVLVNAIDALRAPSHAAQPGRLSGATIDELVRGATVHMHTPLGTKIPVAFADDGRLSGQTSGLVAYYLGASKDHGRWWVKGRRLCQKWTRWFSGKTKCIEIRRQGQKFHWKDREGKTGVATLAAGSQTAVARTVGKATLQRKPSSLGVPLEPTAALPAKTAAIAPTLTTPTRTVVRASLQSWRTTAVRHYVSLETPPPLPTRPGLRRARAKLSSWTKRTQ